MFEMLHSIFGIYSPELSLSHLIARTVFVYCIGIVLVRFNKRFMSLRTVHNFFLYIIIGSLLANSIIGKGFYETLGALIVIMIINKLIAYINYYSTRFSRIIEGSPLLLIDNGVFQKKAMRSCLVNETDLLAFLRFKTNTSDLKDVEKAYFEISGQISFIIKDKK